MPRHTPLIKKAFQLFITIFLRFFNPTTVRTRSLSSFPAARGATSIPQVQGSSSTPEELSHLPKLVRCHHCCCIYAVRNSHTEVGRHFPIFFTYSTREYRTSLVLCAITKILGITPQLDQASTCFGRWFYPRATSFQAPPPTTPPHHTRRTHGLTPWYVNRRRSSR